MPRTKSSEPKKPKAPKPPKAPSLSRTKVERFRECPRCFYLQEKHKVSRPPGPGFSINSAVDTLLKKEFDIHRTAGTPHPLMTAAGLNAVPFAHEEIHLWRNQFKRVGLRITHDATGWEIFGYPDDIWQDRDTGELLVVEYKATAKSAEVHELDPKWHDPYKYQVSFYQWLLRRKGFAVSPQAWFLFANGSSAPERFDGCMQFRMTLFPYAPDDSWIEPTLRKIKETLESDQPPEAPESCSWCDYAKQASGLLAAQHQ